MTRINFIALCAVACTVAVAPVALAQKKGMPPGAAQGAERKVSKGEANAFNAMIKADNPDDRIKLAEELINKYSDTPFKSFALFEEADSYEQKNQHDKAIVAAESALEADAKNYDALFLIANVTAAQTKDTDLDMNDKVTRAEQAANHGMELVKAAEKSKILPMSDAQWEQNKKFSEAQGWQAMGMIATLRKKTDDAVGDFQKAVALNPDPVLMIRAGRSMLAGKKYDDAIAMFDKAATDATASAQIKNIATSDKARATAAKASGR